MKSITFLLTLFLLGACTITKRVHNPGWHVEWKSNHSSSKDREAVAADESTYVGQTTNENVLDEQKAKANEKSENPVQSLNTAATDVQFEQSLEQTLNDSDAKKNASNSIRIKENEKVEFLLEKDAGEKKVHPLAKASLILLCGSVLLFGITLIPAFILSMSALKKMKKNPDQWAGRKMALTVLIISSVLMIPALLLLLLLSISLNYSSGGWL